MDIISLRIQNPIPGSYQCFFTQLSKKNSLWILEFNLFLSLIVEGLVSIYL